MLQILFPKERDFFPVFDQISAGMANAIAELLNGIEHPGEIEKSATKAKVLEEQINQLARESIEHLHDTFITPFDRSHIFQFVILMNKVANLSRLIIEKLHYYSIEKLPLESMEIVINCGTTCNLIRKMVGQLKKIKHPEETLKICVTIHELTAHAHVLALHASKDLYNQQIDAKPLMKVKEVNEDLLSLTKKFADISFLIEAIILEYA